LYYKPRVDSTKQVIKNHITKVFEQIPIYGEKKVHKQLLEDGVKVSLNTVARNRQELGLQAVLALTPPYQSKSTRSIVISLEGLILAMLTTYGVLTSPTSRLHPKGTSCGRSGMVYMATIIDWHSKAVLSYKILNTMILSW